MTKGRVLQMIAVLLVLVLVATMRSLPDVPPLPEKLEADANGWYWGEGQDSLAAAIPEEDGLTVFWVEKAQTVRLFYKKCKTADPAEALKMAAKRPMYTPKLNWEPSKDHLDSALMDAAAMSLFRQANAQGNGGLSVGRFQLPRNTHKAGFALLTALMLEVTPQQALESLEQNVWEGIWHKDRLTGRQEFYYYRGLVDLQWYNLWGTTADVEHRGSTDAQDHLYMIENAS